MSVRGYTTYEWDEVKRLIKQNSKWSEDCTFYDIRPNVRKDVGRLVSGMLRNNARVTWKSVPDFHQIMGQFNPVIITVRRKFMSILKSQQNDATWSEDEINKWSRIIEKRNAMMESMDGPVVDVDEVMAGDFTSIAKAIEHCGMTFKPHLAKPCIDKELWHHA
jgi:hypothetical protein